MPSLPRLVDRLQVMIRGDAGAAGDVAAVSGERPAAEEQRRSEEEQKQQEEEEEEDEEQDTDSQVCQTNHCVFRWLILHEVIKSLLKDCVIKALIHK